MRFHPACELFPLIEGPAFLELVKDIKENGLQDPIVILAIDGEEPEILDGRNRLRACKEAGVEPRFETYKGTQGPAAYVFSKNIARRHMTQAEKAFAAAELLRLSKGAKASTIAEQAGVSASYVYSASAVEDADHPPLKEAVLNGEISMEDAAAVARDEALKADLKDGKVSASEAAAQAEKKREEKKQKAKEEGVETPKGPAPDLTIERLRALEKARPNTPKEAAAALGMSSKAASTELSRLRQKGLIDSGYRLTPAGRDLAHGKPKEPEKPKSYLEKLIVDNSPVVKKIGLEVVKSLIGTALDNPEQFIAFSSIWGTPEASALIAAARRGETVDALEAVRKLRERKEGAKARHRQETEEPEENPFEETLSPDETIQREVQRRLNLHVSQLARKLSADYEAAKRARRKKGVFSKAQANAILKALDGACKSARPDGAAKASEALRLFKDALPALLSEKDRPTPKPPSKERLLELCAN